ncbi:MAG: hypothetical protein OXL96_28390 [Candidatus Poribacteria bacterium]|nr:hypothetical protein [Candidatus Poribacteria bacterium]
MKCVGENIPRTCWDPEEVCTTISLAVGGAAGAACAAGAARAGMGGTAAGAAIGVCGGTATTKTKEVCKTILHEKVCWDWNPCARRDRVCTNNC